MTCDKKYGEPLTLEQLRGMDGKPVFCVSLINGKPGEWCIIRVVEMSKTWLAYAYPPIDRGKWTAKWIKHDGYTECSGCEYWYDSPENEDDGDRPVFCPSCGRAMTPEAWAELGKRLRG